MLERATIEQVRRPLLDGGLVTDEQLDAHLTRVDRGELDLATAPLVTAWGRRPASP